MTLLKQWKNLLNGQTRATVNQFWEEYSSTEKKLYAHLLSHKDEHMHGKVDDLVSSFEVDKIIFVGFLDGINSSLRTALDLENLDENTEIDLDVDFEKLYFNMHKADADCLWNLPEWDGVLTEERRQDIFDAYRRSRTVHVEKKPGRNDPCPCGSGKKYKNCCGKRA